MKTVTVRLGEADYVVPHLNIGQLERCIETLTESKPSRATFHVLRIATERAEPKVDFATLEATPSQIGVAVKAILVLSGLREEEVVQGEAVPEGDQITG